MLSPNEKKEMLRDAENIAPPEGHEEKVEN